jgi:hypothetical protein
MEGGGVFPLCRFVALCVLAGWLVCGCHTSREVSSTPQVRKDAVLITKQPASYANHRFDPLAPPADMPPLGTGETAECDANFLVTSSVRGQTRRTDATHATITIMQVMMTLQLQINVWLPTEATRVVADHEEGHRQIAEYYYQTADKLAERIAGSYIGKRVEVNGTDLDAETNKVLLQVATEITNEFTKEINSSPTQLLYDSITDHARNGVVAKNAVDHAIKNATVEATQPVTGPGN